MTLVFSNDGEVEALSRIVGKATNGNLVAHLYTNNYTPVETSALSNFTEMAASLGYAAITLTGSLWTTTISGGVGTIIYPQLTFSLTTGPVDNYGYYITNLAGSTLVWSELYATGNLSVPSGGGELRITVRSTAD